MPSYLQKLQNLPQNTKKRIMWLFIGIIMFFIFIFWFFVLLPQSPAFKNKKENKSFSELKSQLQEGVTDFKEIQKQILEIKELYSEKKEQPSFEQEEKELETERPQPRLPLEKE